MTIEFTDRYSATGRPRPNPATVCKGRCEGMGFYPTKDRREWPKGAKPDEIGYVFVTCRECGGTGRRDKKGRKADIKKDAAKIRKALGG